MWRWWDRIQAIFLNLFYFTHLILSTLFFRINAVLNGRKNWSFYPPTHPPTQSFCWRNIWLVPGEDGKQSSKEDDNVSNSLWGFGAQSKTTLKSEGGWKGLLQVMGKFKMVPPCLLKDYSLWKQYIFHQISAKMTTPLDLPWNYTNCSKFK